jgi:colanic acid/amylovoran biosynthesis glycosyltransferase
MRIAYLINQYPKVSHSFIRREILALEQQGAKVLRIALRGWDNKIVDDDDASERKRTRYVLRDGTLPLIVAALRTLITRPVRFLRAFRLAWSMSRHAERPLPVHLIYLAEACRISAWLREAATDHVHAHFGTNSAEVAMLVNALGGPGFSFTVHGPEEFDKAAFLGLAEKGARHSSWRSAHLVEASSIGLLTIAFGRRCMSSIVGWTRATWTAPSQRYRMRGAWFAWVGSASRRVNCCSLKPHIALPRMAQISNWCLRATASFVAISKP